MPCGNERPSPTARGSGSRVGPSRSRTTRSRALGAGAAASRWAPGHGYERARLLNPGLVYCSVSGFGAGAGAALPGYDRLVQAVGGLMSVTGPAPGEPVRTGVALVDVLTGLHAAVGVLAALREREATGEGQHVEVHLLTSLLSGMVNQPAGYTLAGAVPGILGNRHPSIAPYEVFEAAGRPLVVAVGNDRQFAAPRPPPAPARGAHRRAHRLAGLLTGAETAATPLSARIRPVRKPSARRRPVRIPSARVPLARAPMTGGRPRPGTARRGFYRPGSSKIP